MRSVIRHFLSLILQPYYFEAESLSGDNYWKSRLSSSSSSPRFSWLNDWQRFRVRWAISRTERTAESMTLGQVLVPLFP